MEKTDLIRSISSLSLRTGEEFKLTSGRTSNRYFEMKNTSLAPVAGRQLAQALADLVPGNTDFLVGIPLGGVPLAARVMDALLPDREVPTLIVREFQKAHGTGRLIEGVRDQNNLIGARTTIVEDVMTTGRSVLKVVEKLRSVGLKVNDVVCAVLREPEALEIMKSNDISVHYLLDEKEFVYENH